MDMKVISSEVRLCTCCMEEHEVKTVLVKEESSFKVALLDRQWEDNRKRRAKEKLLFIAKGYIAAFVLKNKMITSDQDLFSVYRA